MGSAIRPRAGTRSRSRTTARARRRSSSSSWRRRRCEASLAMPASGGAEGQAGFAGVAGGGSGVKTLVFLEDHEGALQKDSLGVLSKAASLDGEVEAVLLGSGVEELAAEAGKYGAARVHVMDDVMLARPLPQPRVDALETLIGEQG